MTRPDRRTRMPRGPEPTSVDLDGTATVTARQAAALVIANYATDPADARELLVMLGLIDDPGRPAP